MEKTSALPWTLSDDTVTVKINRTTISIDASHPNFAAALSALRSKEWDLVPALIDISSQITKLGSGLITVKEGQIFYQGMPVHNTLTDRILLMLKEGIKTLNPMVNFLENCMLNPNKEAVERLFVFLEKGRMPLTPDGCFLGYRGVSLNRDSNKPFRFTDRNTSTFNNDPGQVVQQDRKLCDEDSNQCCSSGLHVCSLPYLGPVGHWGGGSDAIIIVKVNPRDVVAVPYTYSDTKLRCCRFEVLREWVNPDGTKVTDLTEDAWKTSLVSEEESMNPAIKALMDLGSVEEGLEGFETATFTPGYHVEDTGADFDDDGIEYDAEDEVSDETLLNRILHPDTDVYTDEIHCHGHALPKGDDRRLLVSILHRMAISLDAPVYAFKVDRDTKTEGDLKVTPKGSVQTFDKGSERWAAWFQIF